MSGEKVNKQAYRASMEKLAKQTDNVYGYGDQLKTFDIDGSLNYLKDIMEAPKKNEGTMDPASFAGFKKK
jgi:hypothetical protein